MRTEESLPEVIRLRDARGERPENAAGIGEFWYEPEVWTLPLSPAARVLYAGLCSYLGHTEINRRDLRNTLKGHPDREIMRAVQELVRHELLAPDATRGYEVRSVGGFG
jgi:hypothetical protein